MLKKIFVPSVVLMTAFSLSAFGLINDDKKPIDEEVVEELSLAEGDESEIIKLPVVVVEEEVALLEEISKEKKENGEEEEDEILACLEEDEEEEIKKEIEEILA